MNAIFKLNGKIIETKRLILRPFKEDDLDDFFEYASVAGVGEMAGWNHHENKETTKQILDRFIANDKTFAIVFKTNNKVIGSLGIEKYGLEEKLTEFNSYIGRELGFILSKEYWGQGLMKEALTSVIDYLFNVLDYDFLLCGYYAFNLQSKRVQEKCGFEPYRKLEIKTQMKTKEPGYLNILINPNKNISFNFSHPETLIFENRALDCFISNQEKWFRYRTGAIIIEDDCVLLATNNYVDYYYSVGGAVHIGETTQNAIIREVFEETGVNYQIDKLVVVHENFFKEKSMNCHEISLYYLMKPRNTKKLNCHNKKEKMCFIPINDLKKYRVFPSFLNDYLSKNHYGIEHIITNEIQKN